MFDPVQARHVLSVVEAAVDVVWAVDGLGTAIRDKKGTKAELAELARLISRAQRDTNTIPMLLVGYRSDLPTSERLNMAWDKLKRAVEDTLPTALKKSKLGDVNYRLNEAQFKFSLLLNLPKEVFLHADPPFEEPNGAVRTLIAVHGDHYTFMKHMFAALHYWNDWMDTFYKIYLRKASPQHQHFGDSLKLSSFCCTYIYNAVLLACGIPPHTRWNHLDQFGRVLKASQLLWDAAEGESAAQTYHTFMISWAKALGLPDDEVESLIRFSDSWRNTDGGGYKGLMRFPNIRKFD